MLVLSVFVPVCSWAIAHRYFETRFENHDQPHGVNGLSGSRQYPIGRYILCQRDKFHLQNLITLDQLFISDESILGPCALRI